MRTATLDINGAEYLVNVFYENRRDCSVSIGKSVNIRIPLSLTREEQFKKLIEMKNWALKKILENPEKHRTKSQKNYQNGDLLKVNNDEYQLSIEFKDRASSSARIMEKDIHLTISSNLSKEIQQKHISTLLSRCIAQKKYSWITRKVHEINQKHFNKEIKNIFLKNTKSIWGSCSGDKNINLSTRLLFAPEEIIDYVIIHELAHLIEHNHSENFWKIVENIMPDYQEKRNWLKENNNKCEF
ncbi:M48 family metallopeptidase [archaeon]|nr:M48 family metallopeptidase [archaeon]